jgi:hypothetical protein
MVVSHLILLFNNNLKLNLIELSKKIIKLKKIFEDDEKKE